MGKEGFTVAAESDEKLMPWGKEGIWTIFHTFVFPRYLHAMNAMIWMYHAFLKQPWSLQIKYLRSWKPPWARGMASSCSGQIGGRIVSPVCRYKSCDEMGTRSPAAGMTKTEFWTLHSILQNPRKGLFKKKRLETGAALAHVSSAIEVHRYFRLETHSFLLKKVLYIVFFCLYAPDQAIQNP